MSAWTSVVMCVVTVGALSYLLELLVLVHLSVGISIRLLVAGQQHRHDDGGGQ